MTIHLREGNHCQHMVHYWSQMLKGQTGDNRRFCQSRLGWYCYHAQTYEYVIENDAY